MSAQHQWGSHERFKVTPLTALDVIATDDGLPAEVVDRIAEEGPTVLKA